MNEASLSGNYTKLQMKVDRLRLELREAEAKMELLAVAYRRKTGLSIR